MHEGRGYVELVDDALTLARLGSNQTRYPRIEKGKEPEARREVYEIRRRADESRQPRRKREDRSDEGEVLQEGATATATRQGKATTAAAAGEEWCRGGSMMRRG